MLYNEKQQILSNAYKEYQEKQNQLRISAQEKQYAYYTGDEDDILDYLEDALLVSYDQDDVDEMQMNYINLTKKLINQLAIIYNQPAVRYFPNTTEETDQQTNEEILTDYYNSILPDNVNNKIKKAHRLAKLQNTSLTQVVFDKSAGKINYVIDSAHKFNVEVSEDDPYKPVKVSYAKYFKNKDGEDELFTVIWTDTEHYKEDQAGNPSPIGDNEDMTNPYGIIPFALLMLEEGEDIWGEGAHDIINVNEQVNVLLTLLVNEHILLGGAGTVVATNLNLSKNVTNPQTGETETVYQKVRVGRRHPIVQDNIKVDDKDPKLEYVSTNPLIVEIQGMIDWYIKTIALAKGLNPNSFLADVKATSGYSKIIDSLEQLEIRKDDIEPCKAYEKQLFKITRIVNNTHANTIEGRQFNLQIIPEDLELVTDFAEIEIPKTIDEQIKEDEFNLKYNIITPIDIMMRDNPDLTKDEAENMLKENKRIKDTYIEKPQVKTLGQIINSKSADAQSKTNSSEEL